MRRRTRVPDESEHAQVTHLVDQLGGPGASGELGLNRRTLFRIAARLPVYPSTLQRVRDRLAARQAATPDGGAR